MIYYKNLYVMHYPIKIDEENCDITLNDLFIYLLYNRTSVKKIVHLYICKKTAKSVWTNREQEAQLSQRDRATAAWASFGQM